MTSKPNKGRSANEAERAHAKKWVQLYRLAEQSLDSRYYVNPEAPYEEQNFILADDPEPLLQLLECFAKSGKFLVKDTHNIFGMVLQFEIKQEREKRRKVAGGAIEAVANKHNLEVRTVQRLIRKRDKK